MKKARGISKEVEAILKPYNEEIKNYVKVLQIKSDADIKRYTGALNENFKGQVKVIAEQYGDIKKTLDDHSKTLASHTEMVGTLLVDMTVVKEDVKSVKESLKTKVNRKRFVELERRVLAD